MNKKGKKRIDRIDRSTDKGSQQAPIDRGIQLKKAVSTSTLCQNVPEVMNACNAVIKASDDYATAQADAVAADAAAATARSVRDDKQATFDAENAICITTVERHAKSPADIQGLSYTLLIPNKNGLLPMLGMTGKYDRATGLIELFVQHPAGITRCLLQGSPDPITPTSFQRIPGDGLRRKLAGYPPGTHWFRAANVRARGETEFTTPISVVVT